MVIMTWMSNYQFPPVNLTTLLNCWEATKKMTKYFKKSYIHNATHSDKCKHKSHTQVIRFMKLLVKHMHLKTLKSEPEDKESHDSSSLDSKLGSSSDSEWLSWADKSIEIKVSSMKYAANFPVTVNNYNTISVWHRSYHFLDVKSMFWQITTQTSISSNMHIQSKWCQLQQFWS